MELAVALITLSILTLGILFIFKQDDKLLNMYNTPRKKTEKKW